MVKFSIDLRFAGIATDTLVARRQAEVGLRRLAAMDKEIRDVVFDELQRSGYLHDDDERNIAYQEISFLEDHIPRLELYGLVMMLWATYESVVKRLPAIVGPWTHGDVASASGDSFVAKTNRFYTDTLGVPLFADRDEETFVRLVSDVRNAIGHATGEMAILKTKARERLELAAAARTISIESGVLVLTPEYVEAVAKKLDDAASALIDRLKAAF